MTTHNAEGGEQTPDLPGGNAVSRNLSAGKVDPETLVLRGAPRRVTRFRREIIIGVATVGTLAVAAVTWVALEPASFNLAASGNEMFEKGRTKAPEALAGAPGRYDQIPKLGPPLPGDLGRPILEHQRKTEGGFTPVSETDAGAAAIEAERERRIAEATAAQKSPVMISVSTGSRSSEVSNQARRGTVPDDRDEAALRLATGNPRITSDPNVSEHRIKPAPSPWLLSSGSIIAASLVTGLNSDLPGLVVAQVSEGVFDSVTGRTLLIPQGARLIGRYESNTSHGQQRAFLVWQRIIWPDGSSMTLAAAPATDPSGYSGLADRVDNHGWQLLKGVFLSTILGVGTELSFGNEESELVRAMREATQQSGDRAGDKLVARSLDIKPTIVIRPGMPVRALVHQDLILKPWNP